MNRNQRRGFVVLLLPLSVALAGACQRLDPNLSGGRITSRTSGVGGDPGTDEGTGGSGGPDVDCPAVRMQAYAVLQTNCAPCHDPPGLANYPNGFKLILDLDRLTSSTSPLSSTTLTLKYVVKGDPQTSFIYQRIVNGSMPPAARTIRPSAADIEVLNQWITSCIDDPTSPEGWSGSAPDGGAVDAGPELESCGSPAVCPDNGCCVSGKCRPNGTTCGSLPNPIPGEPALGGLPGMCTNGSCETATGAACGGVGQPCCANQSCTATQASCLITDMTMCSACGGDGQPCCKPNNCLNSPRHVCVGARVGGVGTCRLCGGLGQPCCGSGVIALLTCQDALTCIADTASTTKCVAGDGGVDR